MVHTYFKLRKLRLTITLALIFPICLLGQELQQHLRLEQVYEITFPKHLNFHARNTYVFSSTHLFYLSENRDSLYYMNFTNQQIKSLNLDPGYHKKISYKDQTITIENSLKINKTVLSIYRLDNERLTLQHTETVKHRLLNFALYPENSCKMVFSEGKNMIFKEGAKSHNIPFKYYYVQHLSPTNFLEFNANYNFFLDPLSNVFYYKNKDSFQYDSTYAVPYNAIFLDSLLKSYNDRRPKDIFDGLDTLLNRYEMFWSSHFIDSNKFMVIKTKQKYTTFYYDLYEIKNQRINRYAKDLQSGTPKNEDLIGLDAPLFIKLMNSELKEQVVDQKLVIFKQDVGFDYAGMTYADYVSKKATYFETKPPVYKIMVYAVF